MEPKFEFQPGDRVVLLGNTLIEREQAYGYWELALTLASARREADVPQPGGRAATRSGVNPAASSISTQAGYDRTIQLVKEQKPTGYRCS